MTPYGSIASRVEGLRIGQRIRVPYARIEAVRSAGHHRGMVFSIVAHDGDDVIVERIAATRWGAVKARVAQLEIGEALTAPAAQKQSYVNAARNLRIDYKIERLTDLELIVLTRLAEPDPARKRHRIKPLLTNLRIGQTIKVPTERRACSLYSAARAYHVRLSRAKISTGEYVLTRAA